MNTLKFASTAANISNRPVSNVKITPISNIVNPVINQQQFIPIGTPAHLYPSLPYGAYPSQSNVSQANHHNLNTFDNDNVKKEDATEDNQIEDELFKYAILNDSCSPVAFQKFHFLVYIFNIKTI